MRKLSICCLLIVSSLTGCVDSKKPDYHDRAELFDDNSGEVWLSFTKRQWQGLVGPHGYPGYRNIGYWALLKGKGPVFIDPKFQDNPGHFSCVGTITLDREHKRVSVNMRRIVSGPGKPVRTKAHPANGTYPIESVTPAKPDLHYWSNPGKTNP